MSHLFQNLSDHLRFLTTSNELVSRNIANFNTPRYRALGFVRGDSANFGFQYFQQIVTDKNHVKFNNYRSSSGSVVHIKSNIEKWNGNNVDFDSESIKFAKNNLEYEQVLNIFNKMINLIKIAASNSKT